MNYTPSTRHNFPFKPHQKGYTLVELSVAVAIAGVLLIGSIQLVQTILNNSRANDTITGMARSIAQIDKIWQSLPDYSGLTTLTAVNSGAFSDLTIQRNGQGQPIGVKSKFNHAVTLETLPNLPTSGSNRGYAVTYMGIPRGVCADIVTAGVSSGFKAMAITPNNTPDNGAMYLWSGVYLKGAGMASPDGTPVAGEGGLEGLGAGSALVFDPKSPSLNISEMTSARGCGASTTAVDITFFNWK